MIDRSIRNLSEDGFVSTYSRVLVCTPLIDRTTTIACRRDIILKTSYRKSVAVSFEGHPQRLEVRDGLVG